MIVQQNVIALFDFDKTLIDRDSLLPFLIHLQGRWKTFFSMVKLLSVFLRYLCDGLSRQEVKERILMSALAGKRYIDLEIEGKKYADKHLDKFLKQKAYRRLQWHLSQGHRCVLISASLEVYLKPWAKRHGFEAVLGSRLKLNPDKSVTGRLEGLNCWGIEKLQRFKQYMQTDSYEELYMYGDSRGDAELLALADHPYYRTF